MKIIGLQSNNIKRLKAVELKLDDKGNLIVISGKNAQGKSSLLDSIWMALGGKKSIPEKPIREGAEEANISLDVKGEKLSFNVTRTFTEKDSYLKITNTDGQVYDNPQQMLDYLVGNLSFDPLEFTRFTNKEQIQQLMDLTGLNFDADDLEIKELREQRTIVGREGKSLKKIEDAELKDVEKLALAGEMSVSELSMKYNEAVQNDNNYKVAQEGIISIDNQVAKLKEEIERLESDKKILLAVKKPTDDLEKMKTELEKVDETNKVTRDAKARLEEHQKYLANKKEYEDMTVAIKEKEDAKAKKLAEAKMPIEGLSWGEEGVKYNSIPFNQLSGAEQLKVSMAIAMATNPHLRVILIKDGSLLDKDNMDSIMHLAEEKDFQVWCEKVDDSGEIGIYIEDGVVKKIN